jgi:hypothetical protein
MIAGAKIRHDHARAAELAIEAVERIASTFSRHRLEQFVFAALSSKQRDLAREYISALSKAHVRPAEMTKVFDGVVRLSDSDVVLSDLVKIGLASLQAWWTDVERSPGVIQTACGLLKKQLKRLEKLERQLSSFAVASERLLPLLVEVRRDLEHRGGELSAQAMVAT